LNDYPEQIIKKLLTKAGLQPNKKFWEIADSVEARAYQYKFILRVKSGKTSVKQLLPLPPKSDHFRDTFIKDLQSQIKAIDSHAKEQAKIIAAKDAEIRNLQKQSILKNSSIIKAIKPYIKKLGVRE
ncbi:MAG TPA: hypothetical protein VLH77_00055, partial [Gammaproteobacteria bacterium]|nr:hypothetical protein [Gammaproteobacteria bacterium]